MTLSNLLGVMYDDQARRLSRTTDPDTSKEAAESIAPKLSHLQELVLQYAIECGEFGFTDPELTEVMCMSSQGKEYGNSTWRSRRAEPHQVASLGAGIRHLVRRVRVYRS